LEKHRSLIAKRAKEKLRCGKKTLMWENGEKKELKSPKKGKRGKGCRDEREAK